MDIARVFKSKTRKELFRLYFTNPDNEYYLRELERMLDIPVSMIRKELTHLEDAGIFISRRKGNLTYYSLNRSYPLFEELKGIVFKTIGVQGLLKEAAEDRHIISKRKRGRVIAEVPVSFSRKEIAKFCKHNHIRKLSLFGSVLRGDFRPDSDIDVLVEFEPDHVPGFFKFAHMERELSEIIGRKVDLRTPQELSKYFREDVLSEAEVQYAKE